MTVTEAPPETTTEPSLPLPSPQASGLAAVVGTGDPRIIGNLFMGTSLLFLLVSGVAGVLVGFERVDTASFEVLGRQDALQVFTLYSLTGLFLVVLPLVIGLATAVVPLQVGASTLAFPRASAAAYWTYLVSSGLVLAAFALDGGPFGSDVDAVALFVAGFVAVLIALAVALVSIVTTVLTLRAPGMTLRRTPLFSWSMLVAGAVWLLVLPVLAGVMVLAYVDVQRGQVLLGGAEGLYDRIAWVFWQPTVYAFAVPALGITADIVPVFSRRRHYRHGVAMALIGLLGVLGFGAWAQPSLDVEGAASATFLFEGPWILVSALALVPLLGLFGLWALTLFLGRPRVASLPLLATSGVVLVGVGVAAGIGTVIEDLDLDGTTWVTAQANAVLIGTLVAGLAGVAFWAPKLFGKLLSEALTGLSALLLLGGTLVLAVPDAVSGLLDQRRFVYRGVEGAGGVAGVSPGDVSEVEALNLVSAIGGVVVAAGLLLFIVALVASRRRASDDPWGGHTLEWATTSPPPVGNFAELPEITSEAPVYDARHVPAASIEASPTEASS